VILSWRGQTSPVPGRGQSLLTDIEQGALDHSVPLSATLQKCIALGGQARNAELRDWATRELHGYRDNDNEIPEYRIIHVPLMVDAVTFTHQIRGQQISSTDLPDVAQNVISEELKLAHGIGDLQGLVQNAERTGETVVKLGPPGAADLVKLMNYEMHDSGQTIMRLYWDVNIARITGVLEQIRTTLIRLVSEMRATMNDDESMPSSEQAAQAVSVVLYGGKRNHITVISAQADSGATATVEPATEKKESWWTKTATIWIVIGVIVAIIAAYFAYRQWRG
jgi:AbiTii